MFGLGKKKNPKRYGSLLLGDWRAETVRGDVTSEIVATYNGDGSFSIRTQVTGGGDEKPRLQVGRYRFESMNDGRFKIITIDENGTQTGQSVRRFIDDDTMLNELGEITFKRV